MKKLALFALTLILPLLLLALTISSAAYAGPGSEAEPGAEVTWLQEQPAQ